MSFQDSSKTYLHFFSFLKDKMNGEDNEMDLEWDENDYDVSNAAKKLTQRSEELCFNLNKVICTMIEESTHNFTIRKKIARGLPTLPCVVTQNKRITIPIQAPSEVYFLPILTLETIMNEWDEEMIHEFAKD